MLRLTNFKSRKLYDLAGRLEGFILYVGLRNEAYLPQNHDFQSIRSNKEKQEPI